MLKDLVDLFFVFVIVAIPPIPFFILHYVIQKPEGRSKANRRIFVYSTIWFMLLTITVSNVLAMIGTADIDIYAPLYCSEGTSECPRQFDDMVRHELWLSIILPPISSNGCFSDNEMVCQLVHGHISEDMTHWGHWVSYILRIVIFATPSFILYASLQLFYRQVSPRKRKSKLKT